MANKYKLDQEVFLHDPLRGDRGPYQIQRIGIDGMVYTLITNDLEYIDANETELSPVSNELK